MKILPVAAFVLLAFVSLASAFPSRKLLGDNSTHLHTRDSSLRRQRRQAGACQVEKELREVVEIETNEATGKKKYSIHPDKAISSMEIFESDNVGTRYEQYTNTLKRLLEIEGAKLLEGEGRYNFLDALEIDPIEYFNDHPDPIPEAELSFVIDDSHIPLNEPSLENARSLLPGAVDFESAAGLANLGKELLVPVFDNTHEIPEYEQHGGNMVEDHIRPFIDPSEPHIDYQQEMSDISRHHEASLHEPSNYDQVHVEPALEYSNHFLPEIPHSVEPVIVPEIYHPPVEVYVPAIEYGRRG